MNGVYGDMLAFFPELKEMFTMFTMRPKTVGGYYDRENVKTTLGILQYVKPGSIAPQSELVSDSAIPTYWTYDEMAVNGYIENSRKELFRRVKNNNWERIGAMNIYFLEKVIGVTDTNEPDTKVDLGTGRYG